MAKQLLFSEDARKKLLSGVEQISKAVKVTLGPCGRMVMMDKKFGSPTITKDGVSVAKEIELEDPYENMGAQFVREVASKTNDDAGDGTTTATVLSYALVREGVKSVAAGMTPIELKRGMDKAVKILSELGLAKAAKKAGRIAAEGIVVFYDHQNLHQKFAMVELNCETDFAAKNPQFYAVGRDIAMQVVATNPMAVKPEDLSPAYVAEQKALFLAQLKNDPKNANKPEVVLEKIIEGNLNKHFE